MKVKCGASSRGRHSRRSASIGCTWAARREGIQLEASATINSRPAALHLVIGPDDATPKSTEGYGAIEVPFVRPPLAMRQRLPGNDQQISDGPSEACSVGRIRLAAAHVDVDAEIDLDATKENARLPADVRRMRGCLARRA